MTPYQKVDLLRAACCVAGIDGEISPAEKKLIDQLAGEIGVGQASIEAMLDRAKRDPNFYQQQFRILHEDPKKSLVTLIEVAMADKKLAAGEIDVLRGLSKNLQVSDQVFDELIEKVQAMMKPDVS